MILLLAFFLESKFLHVSIDCLYMPCHIYIHASCLQCRTLMTMLVGYNLHIKKTIDGNYCIFTKLKYVCYYIDFNMFHTNKSDASGFHHSILLLIHFHNFSKFCFLIVFCNLTHQYASDFCSKHL
jgi:hypothetical protein